MARESDIISDLSVIHSPTGTEPHSLVHVGLVAALTHHGSVGLTARVRTRGASRLPSPV